MDICSAIGIFFFFSLGCTNTSIVVEEVRRKMRDKKS